MAPGFTAAGAALPVALAALDLDHIRAHVAEQGGSVRACHPFGHVKDADLREDAGAHAAPMRQHSGTMSPCRFTLLGLRGKMRRLFDFQTRHLDHGPEFLQLFLHELLELFGRIGQHLRALLVQRVADFRQAHCLDQGIAQLV